MIDKKMFLEGSMRRGRGTIRGSHERIQDTKRRNMRTTVCKEQPTAQLLVCGDHVCYPKPSCLYQNEKNMRFGTSTFTALPLPVSVNFQQVT